MDVVIRCDGAGLCFTRGSRRQMVAASLRRLAGFEPPAGSSFWAVRGIDLRIRAGARIGICGGNGAGKTTLLRMLCGIYEPDEGRVEVSGSTSALLSLGAGISTHLSGRDNVFVAGALHGLSRGEIAARYDEIAAFAELDAAALATPVRYYSAGMRTRLGFAIAATLTPDLLLLDEVLSTGDVAFREKSAARLRELAAQARCVVFTSHNLRFLREHADQVLWLDRGRQLAFGPAADVLDDYARFMKRAA
jgi:ABC-type polysaccharide/polyol phosphate transport system ATPase subunit